MNPALPINDMKNRRSQTLDRRYRYGIGRDAKGHSRLPGSRMRTLVLFMSLGVLMVLPFRVEADMAESQSIQPATLKSAADLSPPPLDPRNQTFAYWVHGFRKNPNDRSPDLLAFETGHYGFVLNLGDIRQARLGPLRREGYLRGLLTDPEDIPELLPAELLIQVTASGRIYTATHNATGPRTDARRLRTARLWESGRFVQHYDLIDLKLEDPEGRSFEGEARLILVAWPDSLTFTLELTPEKSHSGVVATRIELAIKGRTWEERSPVTQQWEAGESQRLTLSCALAPGVSADRQLPVRLRTADQQLLTSVFDPVLNCQVVQVDRLRRGWKIGYTDIRNYDEFTLEIDNPSDGIRSVPFLLDLRDVANITGLVPMLCDSEGKPTGIPVQLSKNWHNRELGSYLRAYTLLPVPPGTKSYTLRIAYGFYGSLPSASHAQLSLVGYGDKGGNGLWDQLAIGCWGETFCFDVDRSLVDVAITDVRMLMARDGLQGRKWGWTTAGWGGDWLRVQHDGGERFHPNELKTAYLAHGPCLTDVRYSGKLGSGNEVAFDVQVKTPRSDDYARTFQNLRYTFSKEVPTKDAWLFKMGRTSHYAMPRFAYGNADGLIAETAPPESLERAGFLVENATIEGQAPFWLSFPGAFETKKEGMADGYRALVIRSYKATLGGRIYLEPSISVPVHQINDDGSKNLDLLLTAPEGVEHFRPGDTIEMDLEWINLHREADDYYGPNEAYRRHLSEHPSSWKTTYREAIGNDLVVEVDGGHAYRNYPVHVRTSADEVTVRIQGGVGYVPIRFEGLSSASGYTLYRLENGVESPLDQSVNGNDFWQVDYDAVSGSYTRVYNLPLDGLESSTWVLRRE